jgi:hypothetical protein
MNPVVKKTKQNPNITLGQVCPLIMSSRYPICLSVPLGSTLLWLSLVELLGGSSCRG